jgi:hypothetical protein
MYVVKMFSPCILVSYVECCVDKWKKSLLSIEGTFHKRKVMLPHVKDAFAKVMLPHVKVAFAKVMLPHVKCICHVSSSSSSSS